MNLLKVELKADNAQPQPFVAMPEGDKILRADLELNKTFTTHNKKNVLNSIDFNYKIYYRNKDKIEYTINTQAIVYAYAFDEEFKLPLFEYSKNKFNDYQKISITPFDSIFWKYHDEFRLAGRKARIDYFMRNALVTGNEIYAPISQLDLERGFFEHPYKIWNQERITFNSTDRKNTKNEGPEDPWYRGDLYQLSAKLMISPIELNGILGYRSYSIFDPFETHYHLPLDTAGMVFINIYFDLVEIQRREMQQELGDHPSYQKARSIYLKHINSLNWTTTKYLKEVQRGQNTNALVRWNEMVKEELDIDNMAYFNYQPD